MLHLGALLQMISTKSPRPGPARPGFNQNSNLRPRRAIRAGPNVGGGVGDVGDGVVGGSVGDVGDVTEHKKPLQ